MTGTNRTSARRSCILARHAKWFHVNSCKTVNPCRCATALIEMPGFSLSAIMLFSFLGRADHRLGMVDHERVGSELLPSAAALDIQTVKTLENDGGPTTAPC